MVAITADTESLGSIDVSISTEIVIDLVGDAAIDIDVS